MPTDGTCFGMKRIIVDMEDVIYRGPNTYRFIPRRDYGRWTLDRPNLISSESADPMVPDDYDECVDDEALYALAARTRKAQERGDIP